MASAIDSRHEGGVGGISRWRYEIRAVNGETRSKSWQKSWKMNKSMLCRCDPAGEGGQWDGKRERRVFGRDAELILYTVSTTTGQVRVLFTSAWVVWQYSRFVDSRSTPRVELGSWGRYWAVSWEETEDGRRAERTKYSVHAEPVETEQPLERPLTM